MPQTATARKTKPPAPPKPPRNSGPAGHPLERLAADPDNPRRIDDENLAGLEVSLHDFGDISGIVWNERTGQLVCGHQRMTALQRAGAASWQRLSATEGWIAHPATGERFGIRIVDWPPDKQRLANLAANNPHIAGEFTAAALEQLRALEDSAAWEALRLHQLAEQLGADVADEAPADGQTDPDDVPEPPADPITRPGDLWILGDHRLLCGDSTNAADVARLFGGEKADLLVTSPPYNQNIDGFKPSGMHREGGWVQKVGTLAYSDSMSEEEYQESQRAALAVWHSHVRDGGSVFYNHKNRYRDKSVVSPLSWLPGPFTLRQEIIWARPGSVTQNARMFLPSDERIFWMYKGGDFFFDDSTEIKTWSSVWSIALETNKAHPVAFPVELPTRCIRACSRRGSIVFEPYTGSGTTMIAGEQLGRRVFGLEREPRFCDVAVARWEAFTGRKAELAPPDPVHGTDDVAF